MTEAAQRWRILFRRGPDARHFTQRDELEAWEAAVGRSGLPVVTSGGRARPRIATAVPLPVGMIAAAEAIEVLLVERLTAAEVRSAVGSVLPPDHHLVDVQDVWLGAPSLAASVTAAEYRVAVHGAADAAGADPGPEDIRRAAGRLLAAESLPRERQKGERTVTYDLRPFLLDLGVEPDGGAAPGPVVLRMVLAVDPQLGTGRPDEVVGALGEALGGPLRMASGERVRFHFLDDRHDG